MKVLALSKNEKQGMRSLMKKLMKEEIININHINWTNDNRISSILIEDTNCYHSLTTTDGSEIAFLKKIMTYLYEVDGFVANQEYINLVQTLKEEELITIKNYEEHVDDFLNKELKKREEK